MSDCSPPNTDCKKTDDSVFANVEMNDRNKFDVTEDAGCKTIVCKKGRFMSPPDCIYCYGLMDEKGKIFPKTTFKDKDEYVKYKYCTSVSMTMENVIRNYENAKKKRGAFKEYMAQIDVDICEAKKSQDKNKESSLKAKRILVWIAYVIIVVFTITTFLRVWAVVPKLGFSPNMVMVVFIGGIACALVYGSKRMGIL